MLQTPQTSNFNRADMAAMLSAMTREELQWTWSYINNIIYVLPDSNQRESHVDTTVKESKRQACLNRLLGVLGDDGVSYDVTRNEIMEEKYGAL